MDSARNVDSCGGPVSPQIADLRFGSEEGTFHMLIVIGLRAEVVFNVCINSSAPRDQRGPPGPAGARPWDNPLH